MTPVLSFNVFFSFNHTIHILFLNLCKGLIYELHSGSEWDGYRKF